MDASDIQKRQNPIESFFPNAVRTDPFGDNRTAARAYARAERIAAAVHLLTAHMPQNEPLRLAARQESLKLLNGAIDMREGVRIGASAEADLVRAQVRELISILRMLAVAGLVSGANAEIVISALDDLGGFIASAARSLHTERVQLAREDLEPPFVIGQRSYRRERVKDIRDSIVSDKDEHVAKDSTRGATVSNESLSARQQHVLEALRAGGSQGIREVASHLPQYSEKMIQRELAALVATGKVAKEGDKRWSRYTLIGA